MSELRQIRHAVTRERLRMAHTRLRLMEEEVVTLRNRLERQSTAADQLLEHITKLRARVRDLEAQAP